MKKTRSRRLITYSVGEKTELVIAKSNKIARRDCKSRQTQPTHNIPYFLFLISDLTCAMRYMKWIGLAAGVLLVVSCFTPWVVIESRNITVSGVDATGTNYGKPGYFHFLLVAVFTVCTLVPRVWAKRLNLFVTALNLGWALKNFFVLGICSGGECPVKQSGLWLATLSSVLMLISAMFPDMKMPAKKEESPR